MSYIVWPSPVDEESVGNERLPNTVNLEMFQGDMFEFVMTLTDFNDIPLNLTGQTPIAFISEKFDSTRSWYFNCVKEGSGNVRVTMPSQTVIPVGEYLWTFKIVDASNQTRTYVVGNVNMYASVKPGVAAGGGDPPGTNDHGQLLGLSDDDHSQYLTEARADIRYYPKVTLDPILNAKALDSNTVHKTGVETIAGVKTFGSSPVVPTPTSTGQAANKAYVDSVGGGGGGAVPDADATTKGIVQLAGDLAGTAAAPTVPGLATKANDSQVVHKTGAETIAGAKTFSSVIVGVTPTLAAHLATKAYVDAAGGGGGGGTLTSVNGQTGPAVVLNSTHLANVQPVVEYAGGAWPARPTTLKSVVWQGPSSSDPLVAGVAVNGDIWRRY